MHASKKSLFPILAVGLGLAGVILLIALSPASPGMSGGLADADTDASYPAGYTLAQATLPVTPTATPIPAAILYMPWMSVFKTPEVEMLNAWTSDPSGGKLQAFLQGAPMYYQTSGVNHLAQPVDIGLEWQQSGPCSAGQVFSSTISIPSGNWSHHVQGTAPGCTGVFTATASMSYTATHDSLAPRFVVNDPGSVKVNVQQGFDKCSHPDLDDMQVWWNKSPYVVFNLYLGGVSYACKNNPLDAVYVHQLAKQGWWFIPTWVGPQAPCSKYTYKMSYGDAAYQEGRDEADEAHKRAEALGLLGQKIIYYDLEAYSGDTTCRNSVKKFIRGWTERLHELGSKAGGYGASCRSYIEDWAQNDPPPDDIWIAHWILDEYDPSATVWNAVCLDPTPPDPPTYWLNHQRIRQYAGGHTESYGGVPLTIDSNVLDGEVFDMELAGVSSGTPANRVLIETTGPEPRYMGLLDEANGWLLVEAENLLWTADGGDSWRRVTPVVFTGGRILGVTFTDAAEGWAIGLPGGKSELWSARTLDGGQTWATSQLPLSQEEVREVARASLALLEGGQVYAALDLQSGSSFSLGRLFTSLDGGGSWEERGMPLGEPVVFLDSLHGWTAGGAAGDRLFRTSDGGFTWQAQELDFGEETSIEVGLPRFDGGPVGWLPVRGVGGGDALTLVYTTQDGGESWEKDSASAHSHDFDRGLTLGLQPGAGVSVAGALPDGTIDAAGIPQGMVWAITQSGKCEGDKHAAEGELVSCTRSWNLLRSTDSGQSWEQITPPG